MDIFPMVTGNFNLVSWPLLNSIYFQGVLHQEVPAPSVCPAGAGLPHLDQWPDHREAVHSRGGVAPGPGVPVLAVQHGQCDCGGRDPPAGQVLGGCGRSQARSVQSFICSRTNFNLGLIESYKEDYSLAMPNFGTSNRDLWYRHIKSGAESGQYVFSWIK